MPSHDIAGVPCVVPSIMHGSTEVLTPDPYTIQVRLTCDRGYGIDGQLVSNQTLICDPNTNTVQLNECKGKQLSINYILHQYNTLQFLQIGICFILVNFGGKYGNYIETNANCYNDYNVQFISIISMINRLRKMPKVSLMPLSHREVTE